MVTKTNKLWIRLRKLSVKFNDPGVPSLAFAQVLASDALEPLAVSRFRAIMSRESVDESAFLERDGQIPVRWFREAYPELGVKQAIDLGRTFAERAQLTSFGPLSIPLVSAGSVAEVVELLKYLPLISTAVGTQFHPHNGGLSIGLTGQTGDTELDYMIMEYCGSALLRLVQMLAGDGSKVRLRTEWHDSVRRPQGRGIGAFESRAPMSFLHLPSETLNEVCRFSDPIAYRLAIGELQQTLEKRIDSTSLSRKVRSLLDEAPELKSARAVADELSISSSTLKRRLQSEGTTFRILLESSLLERAKLRLIDRSMTVTEIAIGLGYSDLTNFSHAFKRWTGQSPRQFRDAIDR